MKQTMISVDKFCKCAVNVGGLNFGTTCYIVPAIYKMPASLILETDFLNMHHNGFVIMQRRIAHHFPCHGGSVDIYLTEFEYVGKSTFNNVECQSSEQVSFVKSKFKVMSLVCPHAKMLPATDALAYDPEVQASPAKTVVMRDSGLLWLEASTSIISVAYEDCVVEKGSPLGT